MNDSIASLRQGYSLDTRSILEVKLRGQLDQAREVELGLGQHSESGTVEVSVRTGTLRMVKQVEGLAPKQEFITLRDAERLLGGEVDGRSDAGVADIREAIGIGPQHIAIAKLFVAALVVVVPAVLALVGGVPIAAGVDEVWPAGGVAG